MLGHYIHFLNTLDEDVYVRVLGDTWPFPLIAGPIKLTTKDRTGTPYQPFHQDWGFIVKFTKDKDGFKPLAETKSIRVEKDSWRCALEKKSGGGYKVVVENWEKFYTKIKVLLLYTSALADNVKDFIKKWQKVVKEVNETYFKGYYVEIKFIEGLGELVYNNHFGEEKDWEKNLTAVFMNPGAYGDSSFIKKIRDYINALREPFSADILVLWHNRNIKAGARMRKPWYLEKENI